MCDRRASGSPNEFETELNLARGGGGTGDYTGGRRNAGGGEDDGIGQVEIGAVEKVENLGAKLKIQALAKPRVFQHGEIPGGQARSDQSVSSDVSVESPICGCVCRCEESV